MPDSDQTVKLINTREIELFVPVMKELANDFRDRFLRSMLHWCGGGRRAASLRSGRFSSFKPGKPSSAYPALYRQPEMTQAPILVGIAWYSAKVSAARPWKRLAAAQLPFTRERSAAKSPGFTKFL